MFQSEDEVLTRLTGKIPVKVVDSDCVLTHRNHAGSPGTFRLQEVHLLSATPWTAARPGRSLCVPVA